MGARNIGVTSLPPIGCLPAAITLFGSGNNMCVNRLNHDAYSFNQRLNSTSQRLQTRLSGLKLIVLDAYKALNDIIKNPVEYGASYIFISLEKNRKKNYSFHNFF